MTFYSLCRKREVDCYYHIRQHVFRNNIYSKLYGKLHRSHIYPVPDLSGPSGSVFNLAFSPEEDYLVAVLAERAFVIYDPRIHKTVHYQHEAHHDCVNCVTFISERQFATCSDDCTISLWDSRNFKSPLGILWGHQGWVKNIEYDRTSGLLFSVAFQDGVRFWSLDNLAAYSSIEEGEERGNMVATLQDSIRMRLAPNGSKMFVSARNSQCLLIDKFDGKKLHEYQEIHKNFLSKLNDYSFNDRLEILPHNRPSIITLCGDRGTQQKYRIVMSFAFHPSGDFVAMRHTDTSNGHAQQELTSLFDLRQDSYTPLISAEQTEHKYLRYIDDKSPTESADYIKEICFSSDGRVVASPHENGVRLLSLDPQSTSADLYFDHRYHSLHKADRCPDFEETLNLPNIHQSPVLTCAFSHHNFLLASGSLAGTVAFSAPQI